MSQKKYRLDTDSLKIVEYQPTTREKILHFLSVIASGLFFAGVVIAIAYTFFESPKEKILKREIAQYKLLV